MSVFSKSMNRPDAKRRTVFGAQARYDFAKGKGGRVFDMPSHYIDLLIADRREQSAKRKRWCAATAARKAQQAEMESVL